MAVSGVGSLSDLPPFLDRLTRSPGDSGTLVVQVVDAEPFIQFTGGPRGVQMDFPLITPLQRAREPAIRRFCEIHQLHVRATFGSNGSPFIDVELPPNAIFLANLTERAFAEVFDLRSPLQLTFMAEGLGVAV